MSTNCLFCKIVAGELGGPPVYQDEAITAFSDINPQAPVHILLVPNRHIDSVNTLEEADEQVVGHLIRTAGILAKQEGIAENGFRTIINTNADAGQTVFHLHVHIIGGQKLKLSMG